MPIAIFNYWAWKKGMDGKHKFYRSLSCCNEVFKLLLFYLICEENRNKYSIYSTNHNYFKT